MPSKLRLHLDRWKDGCGSPSCERANHVVLARGTVPCDVLFCGEGPGESEDIIGRPFVGPAGRLLDHIIGRALDGVELDGKPVTYAITNLVACIPRDHAEGGKQTEPDVESIMACGPRLQEFVELCNPRLLVCVGRIATMWLADGRGGKNPTTLPTGLPCIDITHPAAILRAPVEAKGLLVQRAVVSLKTAISDL